MVTGIKKLRSLQRFFLVAVLGSFILPLAASDPLAPLSDEFDNPASLANWTRVHAFEQWNADQLEHLDINTSRAGHLTMMPYTSTWYQDYRGELTFKNITGDFAATTLVRPTNRAQTGAPDRDFSLAGILTRTPRNITPGTWTAGDENYLFLSLGCANTPGTYQFEVKTTIDSDSILEISNTAAPEAEIQVARIGDYFIMLRREIPGSWQVHRRYHRTDMSATLQVGMTVYTDWSNVSGMDPHLHNSTVNTGGNPGLIAEFDYFRFRTPDVPPALIGQDLTNETLVPDADLLNFLGSNAVPVALSEFLID